MRPRASCALPVPTPEGRRRLFADARRMDLSDPLSEGRPPALGGAVGHRLRCAARVLLRRPDPQRDRRGRLRPSRSRTDVPDPVDRPGLHGAGGRPCLVRQRHAQARARDRRAVAAARRPAASPRSSSKNAAAQAVSGHRRALRRCRRRLRRQGPHHLPALCRAGRPVLAGPSGASRQRSLRPVPVRHQAPCADGAEPHGGGPRERPDHRVRRPTRISTAAASPISPPPSRSSAPPPRSASTTCPRSTSPRWRGIRAPSPPARCAASARCRP